MTLNRLKTVEIVFHRPNIFHDLLPPIMHSVSPVAVAKLLVVHLRHDLNFSQQVEFVVVTCNQRLYLLAQLIKQGLGISALDSVFKAIILNKIMYALPVYFGYLTEGKRHMLQQVLHRDSSRGFTPYYYDLNTLAENAHYHLLHNSCSQAHYLNHLYTVKPRPPGAMQLRTRGQNWSSV